MLSCEIGIVHLVFAAGFFFWLRSASAGPWALAREYRVPVIFANSHSPGANNAPQQRRRIPMTSARASAIAAITSYKSHGQAWNFRETPTSEIFGANVFSESIMKDRLPKSVYKALQATIKQGKQIDASIADAVAMAMKDWAIEKGATHYAHVFYPLTGLTA